MRMLQFRVLYREFLFRLVDRDLLSVSAQGDASRLVGRLAALLTIFSIPFALPIIGLGNSQLSHDELLVTAWGAEYALIATTMLIVGLFSVLSWNSTYPDRRDILVLGPLPVRASTIFLSKLAALAVALSLAVIIFNAASFIVLPLAFAAPDATPLDLLLSVNTYRLLAAFWITMFASGAFILCSVLAVQGLIGLLPRRLYLRASAFLQMTAFCLFLAGYFLQPSLVSLKALTATQNRSILVWCPSYWFLGLFQQLNGSASGPAHSILVTLATRAWMGLGITIATVIVAFLLSYYRTLRKIVEQPDIVPRSPWLNWSPSLGSTIDTAIAYFSIRSLCRSSHHRLLLAFYSGLGFAIAILFLKTPVVQELSASSADQLLASAKPTCAGIELRNALRLDHRASRGIADSVRASSQLDFPYHTNSSSQQIFRSDPPRRVRRRARANLDWCGGTIPGSLALASGARASRCSSPARNPSCRIVATWLPHDSIHLFLSARKNQPPYHLLALLNAGPECDLLERRIRTASASGPKEIPIDDRCSGPCLLYSPGGGEQEPPKAWNCNTTKNCRR